MLSLKGILHDWQKHIVDVVLQEEIAAATYL